MRNKKPPNFSTYFEQETNDQIAAIQKKLTFLLHKKAVLVYCVSTVFATLENQRNNENERI